MPYQQCLALRYGFPFCVGVVGSPSHEWVEREIPRTSDIPFDIERYVLIATREVDAQAYRREQSCIIPFGPFPVLTGNPSEWVFFHPQACGCGEKHLAPLCPPRCIRCCHLAVCIVETQSNELSIRNYLLRLNFTSAPRNNKQLFETVEIDSLFFIYPYIDIEISGVVILAFNQ